MDNNDSSKIKYCFVYFIMIGVFILVIIGNYLITNDAFSENKIVYLDPNKVCKEFIYRFNLCISQKKEQPLTNNTDNETEKSLDIMCSLENERLLYCFDYLNSFNKRCEIYLSEYNLCKRKTLKIENILCDEILNDIKTCNIWPEYITVNSSLLDSTY